MARDIEVIEADSETLLQEELRLYIQNNDIDVDKISFATYTDVETEQLVYSVSITIL